MFLFLPFTLCRPNLSLQFGNMHQPKQNTYIQIFPNRNGSNDCTPIISFHFTNFICIMQRTNYFRSIQLISFYFLTRFVSFNTIPLLTIQFILIFNIKFNRFIHAYASFTWYQLVYVERCDISVAINCTLNRYYQTKFLFRSPNVMKRQPTSSVVHSQCYTE